MSVAPQQRMAWPDVAKGLSILGVVLLHITLAVPDGSETFGAHVNELIAPLRMPLFFLVSGFFSIKVFRFNFIQLWTKRLWFLAVPYLCWAPVEMWLKNYEWHEFLGQPMPEKDYYIDSLIESSNMYWFLHSLVLFTLVLWASKVLPAWARWAFLVAVVICAPWLPYPPLVAKVSTYLPCFLLGAYGRPAIERFALDALKPWALITGLLSYVAAKEILDNYEVIADPQIRQVLNTVAMLLHLPGGIIFVVLLAKIPVLGEALKRIGRHTLVIYISHPIALTVIFGYGFRYREGGIGLDVPELMGHTSTWVLLCIPVTIAGAFAMQMLSKVPVIGWTLFPPSPEALHARLRPHSAKARERMRAMRALHPVERRAREQAQREDRQALQ
ncbi:acyltransferase family protein [Corynebacterium pseudopelargi]|uniref:Glucans biosynthesis protein n=1 Tax=Corynebacterium pseudopelargi TaxID=2080757 RepID=A0A3G6ITH5_9CORY|nr:acyltransferase family protein [Corynebacterium pseudopelargi]AZA08907.1 glucans biosynthesis protein [Corynebacterium pseudopelargi]